MSELLTCRDYETQKTTLTKEQFNELNKVYSRERIEEALQCEYAVLSLVFDFDIPEKLLCIIRELSNAAELNTSQLNDYQTMVDIRTLYKSFLKQFNQLPRIFPYLVASVSEMNIEMAVKRFNIKSMKYALSLEKDIPSIYHRIIFSLMFHTRIYDVIRNLKKYNRNLESFIAGMPCKYPLIDTELENWIVSHAGQTKNEIIHEVVHFWKEKDFPKSSSLYVQRNYFSVQRKEKEWMLCAEKYPKAFLTPFSCNLINTSVSLHNEQAYILEPNDKKQVILGQLSVCCQRLNGSAEASMMEGLVNPDSGFLVFERGEKLLGQAWIWLTEDKSTLVLDNIELADERTPHDIIDLLKLWVSESPYPNIQMGLGYNNVQIGTTVTEPLKWYTQHWRYQYTDANKRVWLKKENKLTI
ncbi:hypothetical protein U8V72_15300 [Priestia filamentosa]|uniref:hypothetical protein n=1 Tax=Priestia filamentosa TaxID=1402861 RepID=UPI00397E66EB